jgi:hypothetical protein
MTLLLHRIGFYCSIMLNDCFRYYKGYESFQKFRDVQLAPIAMLHLIINSWPFYGWALDFVFQIHTASSKDHRFVLVTVDYFTKWMEDVPLINMTHKEVIHFILEHIIHRFSILSYPIFMPKPSDHRMCAQDHLFSTHKPKVFTDNQMSQIKYNYYINIVH